MAVAVAPPATVSFSRRALDSTPRRPPTPVARAVLVDRFDDEEPDARRVDELLDAFGRHDNRDAHAAGAADVQGVADARGLLEADLTSVSSVPQPQCVSERCAKPCTPRFEARVSSPRDGRKIRKSFPTPAAAKGWRADATSAMRKETLRAATRETLQAAATSFLEDTGSGAVARFAGRNPVATGFRSFRP